MHNFSLPVASVPAHSLLAWFLKSSLKITMKIIMIYLNGFQHKTLTDVAKVFFLCSIAVEDGKTVIPASEPFLRDAFGLTLSATLHVSGHDQ